MTITGTERSTIVSAVSQPSPGRKLADAVNVLSNGAYTVSYSIGAETANAIAVTITVRTLDGRTLDNRVAIDFLVISSTSTYALNTTDYTIAASTGVVMQLIADQVLRVITNATGQAVVTFTLASGAATSFLAAILPGGSMSVSGAITHAA
jgi:hypothetical protein